MIPALLVALAILDGAFAGFRAASGRDGRIAKNRYFARAMAFGAVASTLAVVALAGLTALVVTVAPNPPGVWSELFAMGERLILVFLAAIALVLVALGFFVAAKHEVRTLATVAILGPFTLARPWIILGATAWATMLSSSWHTFVLSWLASATVLAVGVWLDRWYLGRLRLTA